MTWLFTVSRAKVSPASLYAEATGERKSCTPVMTAASRRLAPP
jgi:hypothetical protein